MTGSHAGLFGELFVDREMADAISDRALLHGMLGFEAMLARALEAESVAPQGTADAIAGQCDPDFYDIAELGRAATLAGNPAIPLVKALTARVAAVAPEQAKWVHFGATSQDVIDTALALKLKDIFYLFEARLTGIAALLEGLIESFGSAEIPGRTRMQSAIPITAGDRIRVWLAGVNQALETLEGVRNQNLILSLAGAAGTAEKYGPKIGNVRATLAQSLGLTVPGYVPHAARGRIADLGGWLSRVTGALGKIGQDVALMAQNELGEIGLSGGGGSSAMPHKQNPVRAEVLVSLARFNATQVAALHQSLIHEQERSGAAWTLEWMLLPQMVIAAGASTRLAAELLGSVERLGEG